jgi:cell division protein FtsB
MKSPINKGGANFTVNTDPVFWAMVNAIKELAAENDKLKSESAHLKTESKQIKNESTQIKAALCIKFSELMFCDTNTP